MGTETWSGRSVAWMPEVVGYREVVPLRASGRVVALVPPFGDEIG